MDIAVLTGATAVISEGRRFQARERCNQADLGIRQADRDRQATTRRWSTASRCAQGGPDQGADRRDPPVAIDKSRPRTTTARSCKSGSPSWLVASRSDQRRRAATETEMKERKALIEDALHATRAAVQEGILPGGGSRTLACAREGAQQARARKMIQRLQHGPRHAAMGRLRSPCRARSPTTPGIDGPVVAHRVLREKQVFRGASTRSSRRVRRHDRDGHHRPDQSHQVGASERGQRCQRCC